MKKVSLTPKQKFYCSPQWRKTRAAFIKTTNGLCELCAKKDILKPLHTIHHKKHLTNYDYKALPLNKCFGFDNLQPLCFNCHQKVHNRGPKLPRYSFDEKGNLI